MAWVETKATSWTPTVTQSGSVTVTVSAAFYAIIGEICIVSCTLSVTGSGTGNNAIVIGGQPAAMQSNSSYPLLGTILILDSLTAYYHGALQRVGNTDWRGLHHNAANYIGIVPNFALASGDIIYINGVYRVA